jgi:hypothetical protein
MKKKQERASHMKEIMLIAILFIIIFSLSFYSFIRISLTEYNGITFSKKTQSGITYYEGRFKDTFNNDFTFIFFNNPISLESIEIKGKVEIKESIIVFTDEIDACDNFYDNAIGFPIFLQKMTGGSAEVRSIIGINTSEYNLEENTLIFVKKTALFENTRIEKTDLGYNLYVKNCEIEKSFERFILAVYLNKDDVILTNQVY